MYSKTWHKLISIFLTKIGSSNKLKPFWISIILQVLYLFLDLMQSMSVCDRDSFIIIIFVIITCNSFATEKQSLHLVGSQMHWLFQHIIQQVQYIPIAVKFLSWIDRLFHYQIEYKSSRNFTQQTLSDCSKILLEFQSLSQIKINEMSFLNSYEITKMATTTPIYIASSFPGLRFPPVRNAITSDVGIRRYTFNRKVIQTVAIVRGYWPGGKVECLAFLIKFEFIICSRIASTSFLRMSTPLSTETSMLTPFCIFRLVSTVKNSSTIRQFLFLEPDEQSYVLKLTISKFKMALTPL